MKVNQISQLSHKSKHVPLRRCAVCRRSAQKSELFRFYKDRDGNWQIDPKQDKGFRGLWLCNKSPECYDIKRLKKIFGNDTARIVEEVKLNINIQELKTPVKGG